MMAFTGREKTKVLKRESSETDLGFEQPRRNWQEYFQKDNPRWIEDFGRSVDKDHPIWEIYVKAAIAHDNDVIEALGRGLDILLVFSGLFSAVVTTFIVQVEQDLHDPDTASFTAKALEVIVTNQLNPLLRLLNSSYVEPELEALKEWDDYFPTFATALWYVSLDCALLVAGGAVCMKQWLLEYRRADRLHRVPYDRAIHHQQRFTALRKWHISEFGDLLGSIMFLDLIPFFAGG
ncbi:hypothetical protein FRC03_003469 [Tulasnella sp. 419]|nr:hypothetical protein FRC03_003469 [Tulasnella sp. 419]